MSQSDATLDILADRETNILLDGKPIGKTPLTRVKVAPGGHDVTFVDEQNGNRTMRVTVAAGETQTVKADRPPPLRELKDPAGDPKQ